MSLKTIVMFGLLSSGALLATREMPFSHQGGDYGSNLVYSWCHITLTNDSGVDQTVSVSVQFEQIGLAVTPSSGHQLHGTSCGSITSAGNTYSFVLTNQCQVAFLRFFYASSASGGIGTVGPGLCRGKVQVTEDTGFLMGTLELTTHTGSVANSSSLAINHGRPF